MGKLIFKAVALLVITVGMSHYGMYLMTGKSPLSDFSFSAPDIPSFSAPSLPQGRETAYKWTDENGVTHYSSEPPQNQQAKAIEVDPNTNLVQGMKIEPKAEKAPEASAQNNIVAPGPVYNPQTVKKLIDDAQAVQGTLNKRYESLENY